MRGGWYIIAKDKNSTVKSPIRFVTADKAYAYLDKWGLRETHKVKKVF
jgi:hypothetical protein